MIIKYALERNTKNTKIKSYRCNTINDIAVAKKSRAENIFAFFDPCNRSLYFHQLARRFSLRAFKSAEV